MKRWVTGLLFILFFGLPQFAFCAADTTFFFYISADAQGLFGEYFFYDHLTKLFDRTQNPNARHYNAVILFDPYRIEDFPTLDVFKEGERLGRVKTRYGDFYHAYLNSDGKKIPLDMGDPKNLLRLFEVAKEAGLSSKRNILVVDGHGSSWQGVALDTDGDRLGFEAGKEPPSLLSVKEFVSAVHKGLSSIGKPSLDAIVFNACIMGSLEVLYELREIANFVFASSLEVPTIGSDFDHSLTGTARAEALLEYPHYLKFNLKFDFLKKRETLPVAEILEQLVRSRVIVSRESDSESHILSTREGEPLFKKIKESPFFSQMEQNKKEQLESFVYRISPKNYFYVETKHIGKLVSLLKEIVPGLVRYAEVRKKIDLFEGARLFQANLGEIFFAKIELRRLLLIFVSDPLEKRYFGSVDKQRFEDILASLSRMIHTVGPQVATFSVFLPSIAHYKNRNTLRRDQELNFQASFEKVMADQGLLQFNRDSGWEQFIDAYLEANTSLDEKIPNVAERRFLDDDVSFRDDEETH